MAKYKLPKIQELLDSGVHFGHQVRRWHPRMEPYIYSVKKNIHIIDLEKTEELIKEAAEFLYETAKAGKTIVFIGTKKQARDIVEIEAKRSGALFVTERWLGGTMTNFPEIKKNNIDKLLDLKRRKQLGELEKYTKKERLMLDREIDALEKLVGGISSLTKTPDVLFLVDSRREKTAIREAKLLKVPVVALLDTNSDPTGIDYVIAGNDDAIKSVACVVKAIADAVAEGYMEYAKASIKEKVVEVEPAVEKKQPVSEVTASEAPHVVEKVLAEDVQEEIKPEEIKAE